MLAPKLLLRVGLCYASDLVAVEPTDPPQLPRLRSFALDFHPSTLFVVIHAAPYGGSGIGFARLLKPLQFARNRVVMLGIPPVDGDLLFGNDAAGGQDK